MEHEIYRLYSTVKQLEGGATLLRVTSRRRRVSLRQHNDKGFQLELMAHGMMQESGRLERWCAIVFGVKDMDLDRQYLNTVAHWQWPL